MILADSSVWIDHFRDVETPASFMLAVLLAEGSVATADLVIVEILQGIDKNREFDRVLRLFKQLDLIIIADEVIAIEAARNFRRLRSLGITVRKTIDTLIATRCIQDGHTLLYSDRDFDPFVEHLGLESVL